MIQQLNDELKSDTIFGTIYGVGFQFIEPAINHHLSNYIADNYGIILEKVRQMGVHMNYVEDMVQDVYLSYLKAENEGDGFDSERGLTVEQAVYGRLKRYSKNTKYQKPTEAPKKKATNPEEYDMKEICATAMDTELDNLSPCQKIYNMCASVDNIDAVEEKQSLAEQLNFVLSFEDCFKISLKGFFNNIEDILDNIDKMSSGLFDELLKFQDEQFKDALLDILSCSFKDPGYFRETLSKVAV